MSKIGSRIAAQALSNRSSHKTRLDGLSSRDAG